MNILYIGGGFVGACSAAISGDSGHNTMVFDVDEHKVKKLSSGDRDTIESCLFEKGLGDLLVRNSERITFTTDYADVEKIVDDIDAIFLCLPTPEIGETGESDMKYYHIALNALGPVLAKRNGGKQAKHVVVVNKSTVPIDTVDVASDVLKEHGVENVGVVSNPEFLVEGKAIEGSLKPDRIVIGAWSEEDFEVMRKVYRRFYDSPDVNFIEVNPKEAAAGKLLANYYLFNKVVQCFDVIGRTAEAFDGIQFEQLRKILVSEKRIGSWGFYDSLYAGGSCFIKDARSLSHQLQTAGHPAVLVDETYLANKRQLEHFISRAQIDANVDWAGKNIALLGLAFKRDTNDIRNSPSIDITQFALAHGVEKITTYDPVSMENFGMMFEGEKRLAFVQHEFEALTDADIIIIATDWPQFRGLADVIISECADKKPLIMDGRRMLQHRYEDLKVAGFTVIAVGSSLIQN